MIFCATVVFPLALPPQIPITKGSTFAEPWVLYHGGLPAERNRNIMTMNDCLERRFAKKKRDFDLTSCVNCPVIWYPDDRLVSSNGILASWGCSLTPGSITTRRGSDAKSRNCRRRCRQRCIVLALETAIVRVNCSALHLLTFICVTV